MSEAIDQHPPGQHGMLPPIGAKPQAQTHDLWAGFWVPQLSRVSWCFKLIAHEKPSYNN